MYDVFIQLLRKVLEDDGASPDGARRYDIWLYIGVLVLWFILVIP